MSKTIDRTPTPPWPGEINDNHVAGFTRRSVLAGAAATAVITIGADTPAHFWALYGANFFYRVRGEIRLARDLALELLGVAERLQDRNCSPTDISISAIRCFGSASWLMRGFLTAMSAGLLVTSTGPSCRMVVGGNRPSVKPRTKSVSRRLAR